MRKINKFTKQTLFNLILFCKVLIFLYIYGIFYLKNNNSKAKIEDNEIVQ